jgi:hypothetical protein
LSDKTFFELNGRQTIVSTEDRIINAPDIKLNSLNEWLVEGWGNYQVTEKVTAGVGGTVGWRDIRGFTSDPTPNQTFEQGLVRGSYRVTEKLDVNGSAGLQFSQFQNGDDKGPTFIFSLGGAWQPLEQTSVALEAYRRDVPSYVFNSQNYTLTGTRASVRQSFLEKYSASVSAGFENSDYTKTSSSATGTPRSDNYFWLRPAVDYQLNDRWAMGLFYQYRTKNSNQDIYDYSNNQGGVYSTYRF